MKKIATLCIVMFASVLAFAGTSDLAIDHATKPVNPFEKVTAAFGSLNAHRMGKGTSLTWKMVSEDGVAGYVVKRTYSDPNDPYSEWAIVGSADANGARSYNVREDAVFPGYIYYKVIAVMQDGSTEESAPVPVRIVAHK